MNNIEEEFYNAFEIEPKTKYYCPNCKSVLEDWWYGGKYPNYECSNRFCDYETYELSGEFKSLYKEDVYPPITDRMLLELICILINTESPITYIKGHKPTDINAIKRLTLNGCIKYVDDIKKYINDNLESEFSDNDISKHFHISLYYMMLITQRL